MGSNHPEDAGTIITRTKSVGTVGVGILLGLIVVNRLMPAPVLPLTDEQISELDAGRMVVAAWPKMTSREKARIKKLYYDAAKKRLGLI